MKAASARKPVSCPAVVAIAACLGWWACGSSTTSERDGGASNGGAVRFGSGGAGGSARDAAPGMGGMPGDSGTAAAVDALMSAGGTTAPTTGTGGGHVDGGAAGSGGQTANGGRTSSSGGTHLTGGTPGSGGSFTDGGQPGSGGMTGAGGQPGSGGGVGIDAATKVICTAEPTWKCPAGQFCDYPDHCGMVTDSAGICMPTGPDVACDTIYQPVCSCNGKTYGNDCERAKARAQKYSDGECAAGRDAAADTDRNAGVAWQAVAGGATTGPSIVVTGRGWYAASTDMVWEHTSSILFDGTPSYGLTNAQLDDLFARLAAINFSSLPHASTAATGCTAKLIVGTCLGCEWIELEYTSAAQLAPELEPVWAWFDQVLGSPTIATNPRTYCAS
jgi:hypothetical protein